MASGDLSQNQSVECELYNPTFKKIKMAGQTDCMYRIDDNGNCGFCSKDEHYRCVKEVAMFPIPLSASTVSDFITCPWLYYLKNIRGVSIKNAQTSKPIKIGKLVDVALQNLITPKSVNVNKVIDDYEIGDFEIGKVRAIIRAYKTLGIRFEPGANLQAKFDMELEIQGLHKDGGAGGAIKIKGFYDRKYANYFVEGKVSSRPENYLDIFFIQSQVGAYFLADPSLEYCIMEVIRTPDLRSIGKFKEESPEEHEERTYQDIISRPSFYFIGLDKASGTFGKKFYRNEFDLEEIRNRFRSINIIIHDMQMINGWYKNDKVCNAILPGIPCDMKPLCRYNVMSETMYNIRKKHITL